MNTRIIQTFNKCKREKRCALVAYITGGDPDPDSSFTVADAVINGGADILELGIPFSDPIADGEANQLAAERALSSGATPLTVIELASKIRQSYPDLPIVIFTYLNPIAYSAKFTFEGFCKKVYLSGVDALLCLDLPPEEDKINKVKSYSEVIKKNKLGIVSLVAPTTPLERIPILANFATSFVYYVSREGVTGESKEFNANFASKISHIKKFTSLPVVVGFGISSSDHVKKAARTGVDGVVVGSAIVRKVERFFHGYDTLDSIKNFVSELKRGVYLG
ncbi:MAG TPA: tryptophan synthase subunit alpha [Victivallales bacterium]|nr:tryptophan synthase subunit alpha [Victivallales bacterium]HRR27770.1 tryptophan synthase subunit alpha [Victivallales bacterium]HRU01541.1 tryptophan synthase subunit alpha [Victivallales bacterium]